MTNSEDDFLIEFDDDDSPTDKYEYEELGPCPICGEPEVEVETGLCAGCNELFNGAVAAQILGASCD